MPNELVIVATFGTAEDATLARDRLLAAGLRARVTERGGGLAVRVPTDDADQARLMLDDGEIGGEDEPASPPPRDSPPPNPTPAASVNRDELAGRALAVTIACIILFPLLPYACWLLSRVFFTNERLSPPAHGRALVAACICVPLTLAWTFFLVRIIS